MPPAENLIVCGNLSSDLALGGWYMPEPASDLPTNASPLLPAHSDESIQASIRRANSQGPDESFSAWREVSRMRMDTLCKYSQLFNVDSVRQSILLNRAFVDTKLFVLGLIGGESDLRFIESLDFHRDVPSSRIALNFARVSIGGEPELVRLGRQSSEDVKEEYVIVKSLALIAQSCVDNSIQEQAVQLMEARTATSELRDLIEMELEEVEESTSRDLLEL
ncbi:hypothetical protein [Allorhodopirellula solitaria]|nr:hypothetical protein [Allorhodopirellula solitaria]